MDRITGGTSSILPFDTEELLVKPVQAESTALQVFNNIITSHSEIHVPTVENDPEASWVAENAEYGLDEVELAEVTIRPRKLGKLIPVSTELADDSDPAAMEIVGAALVRAISKAIDNYTFGSQAASVSAFAGLANSAAYTFPTVTSWDGTNSTQLLDACVDAIAIGEGKGYTLSNFVMHSSDVVALAKDRELNTDPAVPTRRVVKGVPIVVCDSVPAGTVYGIDPRAGAMVIREDSAVEIDRSAAFTRDGLLVKGRMRVALGVLDPNGIVVVKATD